MSRRHNNANILCLPADLIGEELTRRIVEAWLKGGSRGGGTSGASERSRSSRTSSVQTPTRRSRADRQSYRKNVKVPQGPESAKAVPGPLCSPRPAKPRAEDAVITDADRASAGIGGKRGVLAREPDDEDRTDAPGGPEGHFLELSLAMEYAKEGRKGDAVEQFARVIELDPNHISAYYQQAQVLVSLDRGDDARQVLERGVAAAKRAGDGTCLTR